MNRQPQLAQHFVFLALACSLTLSLPVLTRAEGPTYVARERARQLFERGVSATSAGAYEEALHAFEEAHALSPHPTALYNVALSAWALGYAADALAALERYLGDGTSAVAPEKRAQAQGLLERWREAVGVVTLQIEPRAAELLVDGRPGSPGELVFLAGWHHLRASMPGHRSLDYVLYVGARSRRTLRLELAPSAASEMPQLELVVFPYGKAWLSGAYAGDSPVSMLVPPGDYVVSAGRDGGERQLPISLGKGEHRQVVVAWSGPMRDGQPGASSEPKDSAVTRDPTGGGGRDAERAPVPE